MSVSVGEVRDGCCACCLCGRQSQEGGRCAIKIFTHESATTAGNLDCILILHLFLCGVCSWWSECERIQLCVMCWEAVVIVGVI